MTGGLEQGDAAVRSPLQGFVQFMVVGAQKAGTTTLHSWLAAEDGVELPTDKETHYFSDPDRRARGRSWYRASFAGASEAIRGEVDPDYLSCESAADAIRDAIGDVRVLVVLRDPLSRAHSQYLMSVRRGLESRTFEVAVSQELASIRTGGQVSQHHNYLWRSLYGQHISRYLDRFTQVKVLRFEDIFSEDRRLANESYLDAFRFLTDVAHGSSLRNASAIENKKSEPKSKLLASAVWDRDRFIWSRRVARSLVPSQKMRTSLASTLERWNRVEVTTASTSEAGPRLPGGAVELIEQELTQVEELTGLDLAAWRRRGS